jgi:fluoride exporter
MNMLKNFLFVGLGGGIGAMLRYLFSSLIKHNTFPYNTLFINIAGSLLIGIIFGLSEKTNVISEQLKLFLATGICGGFTTFSAFSVENMQMLKDGNYVTAAMYIFVSVALCIVAVLAGFKIINYSL